MVKGTVNIEGSNTLVRDLHSHAVINKDTNGFKQHMASREKKKQEEADMNNLKNDVEELKATLAEILTILKTGSK